MVFFNFLTGCLLPTIKELEKTRFVWLVTGETTHRTCSTKVCVKIYEPITVTSKRTGSWHPWLATVPRTMTSRTDVGLLPEPVNDTNLKIVPKNLAAFFVIVPAVFIYLGRVVNFHAGRIQMPSKPHHRPSLGNTNWKSPNEGEETCHLPEENSFC